MRFYLFLLFVAQNWQRFAHPRKPQSKLEEGAALTFQFFANLDSLIQAPALSCTFLAQAFSNEAETLCVMEVPSLLSCSYFTDL
jgi:hypothetical protein